MPATKLTDTQLVILSTASKAEAPLGTEAFTNLKAKGAALTGVINKLIERGFLKESDRRQQRINGINGPPGALAGWMCGWTSEWRECRPPD